MSTAAPSHVTAAARGPGHLLLVQMYPGWALNHAFKWISSGDFCWVSWGEYLHSHGHARGLGFWVAAGGWMVWFSCAVQVITMAPPSFPFRWLEPRSCRVEEQKSYQKMAQKKMTLRDVDSRVMMLTRFVNSMWILVFWKTWLCWLFFDACGNARGSPKLEGADLHSAASARKGGSDWKSDWKLLAEIDGSSIYNVFRDGWEFFVWMFWIFCWCFLKVSKKEGWSCDF